MTDHEYHKALIKAFHEKHKDSFKCTFCGCPKTMANLDKDNKVLPGRLCMKCAKPVIVAFIDTDAPWKHSRGPWMVVEHEGNLVIESEDKVVATFQVESIKKARFDAELMATSPELLFWLGRILDLFNTKANENELNEAIVNALGTISRAERWAG